MPRHHHRGPRDFLTEEEKQNAPKVTKELLFRILNYLKPYWLSLCAVLVVIFLSAILGLLPSIITAKIIDQAILGNNLSLLFQLVLIAILTLFTSQVMGVLETYINAYISYQIIYDMKNEMFNHLQSMPHSFFTTEKQGDIITRMNSDISGVSTVVSNTLAQTISNGCVVITTVIALMKMNWQLALVGILIIPFLILPTKTAGKKRWTLASLAQEGNDQLNDIINESLSVSGSLLIKLFTREQDQFELFKKTNKKVIDL
ncbi:MAG: ABC transporter transmembrane domain-containing protein, partial [Floccifex sp.]